MAIFYHLFQQTLRAQLEISVQAKKSFTFLISLQEDGDHHFVYIV
jgi:hypothetical protein